MISDPGFRAARKAGAQGAFRLFFPPLFLLGFLLLVAGPFSAGDGVGVSTPFLVVAVIVGVIVLLIFGTRARRWSRNRGAWSRAARGAVTLTLRGEAVGAERKVSGRPMRTVVVEHRGSRQYLHLLFAPGAPVHVMGPGWVTVEFFAGDDAEGPARLLLADGRTLWAFSARLGAVAAEPRSRARRSSDTTAVGATDDGAGFVLPAVVIPGLDGDHDRGRGDDRPGDPDPSPSATENGGSSNTGSSDAGSSSAVSSSTVTSSAVSSGTASAGTAAAGVAASSAVWAGGDGWTGGSSWGGDPTWSGSDTGDGHSGGGSDGGGGGWFGGGDSGGWSGGDSGGGGGDAGGGF